MQFQEQTHEGSLPITACENGAIEINGQRHSQPLCLCGNSLFDIPETAPADLNIDSFGLNPAVNPRLESALAQGRPEVILVGTGAKQIFLHPKITAALAAQGIGLESMSTQAACRTYMILSSEGRRVWAWLWP